MADQKAGKLQKVISLCFLVALFEGLDIQSMGVAAPRLGPDFHLQPQQLGLVLSASTFGLMIGAAVGGWASDKIGRKAVLILSMLALGTFSLVTTGVHGFGVLIIVRILAGIGLGGAFPNLIALAADVAPERLRVTLLGIIYCGLPLGGAAAGALMSFTGGTDWRLIFYVGGIGPLVVALVLMIVLPGQLLKRPIVSGDETSISSVGELFGSRSWQTILLWLAFFFTLMAVYLLLNWLPSLMIGKGLSHVVAAQSAVYLNVGAVIGSLIFGVFSDRRPGSLVLVLVYLGMVAALIGLVVSANTFVLAAAFAAGFFVIGGQLVLYALAPTIYPFRVRGTGVGAAVAIGRLGSILGPILGGVALARGITADRMPAITGPGLVIAMIAVLVLLGMSKPTDLSAERLAS